jgi:hypothetical protein
MDLFAKLLKIQLPLIHTATQQSASMTLPTMEKEQMANGNLSTALDIGSQTSLGSAKTA